MALSRERLRAGIVVIFAGGVTIIAALSCGVPIALFADGDAIAALAANIIDGITVCLSAVFLKDHLKLTGRQDVLCVAAWDKARLFTLIPAARSQKNNRLIA